ncbi:MAG: YihY/virulence factor BrkB family protein [Vulcanimicrobiaceae bacterium]
MAASSVNRFVSLAKETIRAYGDDEISRQAAALAYFTMFAIAPLLIVLIEIAALTLGGSGHHRQVRDAILNTMQPSLGKQGTDAVGNLVQSTFNQSRKQGVLASVVSWIILMLAATGLFGAIQAALDDIWHVKREKRPWWTAIRERLVSFALIAGVAFLLVISLAINAAVAAAGRTLTSHLAGLTWLVSVVDFVVSLAMIAALFAAIFKFLPHVKLRWSDVWLGADVAALLFTIGQLALSWYLGRAATASTFGAAGSLVIFVLWLYYSGQIFLIGAEFTKVYAQHHGSRQADLRP